MKKIVAVSLCLLLSFAITACTKNKEDNYNYGDIKGKATGTVEMTDTGLYVEIDDILADVGDTVDFTSGIKFKNVSDDAYIQIYADTSAVDIWEPGTYEVAYTVSYDDISADRLVHVTIEEPEVAGGSSNTSSKSGGKQTSGNQTYEDETTEPVEKDIDSAKIDLLSGGVATVKQTNFHFIEETYTENSYVERNGRNYSVSKLIVKFNTGELQVLETIEHPVD